jgi:hypothetical protein
MLCAACKNKTTTDRCPSKALKNIQFCGKHAKCKTHRLWVDVNHIDDGIIKIQSLWRGWIIRHLLHLAGPGLLNKSLRHNQEDVVTYETYVHPLDYFAFEEDGKVYWFDIRTIFQLSIADLQPTNPYTRTKLTFDTRKRLKECVNHRDNRDLKLFHDPLHLSRPGNIFQMRWMMISQMMEESLFIDVNPLFFTELNLTQLWELTAIIRGSILHWAKEHSTPYSRRNTYYIWINNCWRRQSMEVANNKEVCYYLGGALLRILKDCKNPHDVCFKILSARYNL